MKKSSILFVLCMAIFSFLFFSCDTKSSDILEGTWKGNFGYNSSTQDLEIEMTYVFDGKGNYTFTGSQSGITNITKGTYKLIDGKYLHTYCTVTNGEGISRDIEEVLELNTSSKPYYLSADMYDGDGNILQHVRFYKQ